MENKFVLVICEGISDETTLRKPLQNFVKKNGFLVNVETTTGDIAYKEECTEENCVEYIRKIINKYEINYHLLPIDFMGVYHIIDTDAAFISDDYIVQTEIGTYVKNNLYYTDKPEEIKLRNKKKNSIYNLLQSLDKINEIPYKVLFFSRNLEHALYNKETCSTKEKISLSNQFEMDYSSKGNDFYNRMLEIKFNVPEDYSCSWDYIKTGSNSMERGSNISILLDDLKKYFKMKK